MTTRDQRNCSLKRQIRTFEADLAALIAAAEEATVLSAKHPGRARSRHLGRLRRSHGQRHCVAGPLGRRA